jgi:uncharacterized protein involved in type VI secretion and phage assembly
MQQVKATIELETGKKLTHYTRLRIEQSLFSHHSFEVEVPFEELEDPDELFFHQAHQEVCGKSITFSFEPVLENGSFAFAFKGIVTEIALKNTSNLVNVFVLKGYSPTILLEDYRTRKVFADQSLRQIADAVLGKYPRNMLRRQIEPKHNAVLPYVVQYNETNFAFLGRLAAEYGEWFYYNGKELVLGDHASGKTVDFEVNGIQTCNMSIALRPLQFKLAAYDYTQDEHYQSVSADQSVDGLGKFSSFALEESEKLFGQASEQVLAKPFQNQQEVDEAAKTQKAVGANFLVDFRGSGESPDFMVGSVLDVSGVRPKKDGQTKDSFGKYRVIELVHEVDGNGNYQNHFKAIPESAAYPPSNPEVAHPVAHSDLALVVDNDDPEKLGRVKVEFLWPSDSKESAWVRVGHPYTGEGKGMLFLPEVGAQVMVGYQDRSPEMPYILTSLYPKSDSEEYTPKDNTLKQILFKGGNMLSFLDDPDSGKQQITISNVDRQEKASLVISFADDGQIELQTQGDILLKADKDISLKAKNISLKADEKMSLEAMEVKLKANKSIEQEAGASLKLKGMEIKAEADTNAEIKANAQLKLSSSATTDISGGAMVKVEAAIIKLN